MTDKEQLALLRGEITVLKNIIFGSRAIDKNSLNIEYKKDINGRVLLDDDNDPIVSDETLGQLPKMISKLINVENFINEEGKTIFDSMGKPIPVVYKFGTFPELLYNYLNIEYLKNGTNIIYDEKGNPILNESTYGMLPKEIFKALKNYLNIEYKVTEEGNSIIDIEKLGSVIKYIYDEFFDKFAIAEKDTEPNGTVINLLKNNQKELLDKINSISIGSSDIVKSINSLTESYNTLSNSIVTIIDKLDAIKEVVDKINENTKPSE